jgi:hypothetical protein
MNRESVAEQIRQAFADTPQPGLAFDDISATKPDEGIVAYFRGSSWQGHRVDNLRYHYATLSFFTDKAFRYWLPAFMLADLENPVAADVIGEGIAFSLGESWDAERRIRQFSQQELRAIAAYLDLQHGAEAAAKVRKREQEVHSE